VRGLTDCKPAQLHRQVIQVPGGQPRISCIKRRLPTPPPDICERICIVKPPRDVVEVCIEKPYRPPPCYVQREICGKARRPLIQPRVVCVPPRSNPCLASASMCGLSQPIPHPQPQPPQPCPPSTQASCEPQQPIQSCPSTNYHRNTSY
jgi:hypothetical protein